MSRLAEHVTAVPELRQVLLIALQQLVLPTQPLLQNLDATCQQRTRLLAFRKQTLAFVGRDVRHGTQPAHVFQLHGDGHGTQQGQVLHVAGRGPWRRVENKSQ